MKNALVTLIALFGLESVRISYGDIGVALLAFCAVVAIYCVSQMAIALYDWLIG